jgi:predicted outer membrane repeat protein
MAMALSFYRRPDLARRSIMWFYSWFGKRQRSAASRRSYGSPRKRPTYRPRLEALEGRWLPSQVGLTVTSLTDSGPGTLRAAILGADVGSHSDKFTIGFAVTGTIDLQSPLPDLNNNIAIQGPGVASLTVERAAGVSLSSAILTVDAGQTATLSGLTIANGNEGGIINEGTLTLATCAVMNNSGSLHGILPMGGGIFNDYSGILTVTNSTLSGNSALHGGGIFSFGALTVSGSTVSGNSAVPFFVQSSGTTFHAFGGGIESDNTLTMTGSTISGNTAERTGGGIYIGFNGTVSSSISGSTITGNFAGFEGGGIDVDGVMAISNSQLAGNSASQNGGGIANDYSLTVSGCAFTKNSATDGGAIYNNGETTVRDSSFTKNSANLAGAIYNVVAQSGFNVAVGTLDVRGCSFSDNTASDSGGGIYNLGTATVQLSTLSGNTASSDGGGIFNAASGTLTVKDSTVQHNLASLGADIYNLGALTLDDSTVGVIGP